MEGMIQISSVSWELFWNVEQEKSQSTGQNGRSPPTAVLITKEGVSDSPLQLIRKMP